MGVLEMGGASGTSAVQHEKKKNFLNVITFNLILNDEVVYHDAHRLLIPLLYERRKYGNTKARNTCDSRLLDSFENFRLLEVLRYTCTCLL
jgi:hypothetical protein